MPQLEGTAVGAYSQFASIRLGSSLARTRSRKSEELRNYKSCR